MVTSLLRFCIILFVFIGSKTTFSQSFEWAKSFGGYNGSDYGSLVKADHAGNVYTVGRFYDQADLDPGPNIYTVNHAAGFTKGTFISKLDANGDFLWGFTLSGYYETYIHSIETDSNNDLLIAGRFTGCVDFDPGPGTYTLCSDTTNVAPKSAVYLLKVNSNGDFISAFNLGGKTNFAYTTIALDPFGNIFISSSFSVKSDFDPSAATAFFSPPTSPLYYNETPSFITKLDSSGNYIWTKSFIGHVVSIATNQQGDVYTQLFYRDSADVDPSTSVYNVYNNAIGIKQGAVISKLNNNGNFVWAKNYPGLFVTCSDPNALHLLNSISVDTSNGVYFCGAFRDSIDFDPGADSSYFFSNNFSNTFSNFFVTHLDGSGNYLWTKTIENNRNLELYGFDVDPNQNLYFFGSFDDTTDFDPSSNTFFLYSNWGWKNAFLLKLNSNGNFVSVKSFCGSTSSSITIGSNIDVDSNETIYTVGSHIGATNFDFPSSALVPNFSSGTVFDVFVAKHSQPIVSVSEKENLEKIAVYPNPSSGSAWLSFEKTHPSVSVIVYNVFGQELDKKTYSNTSRINLNINGPQGVYYLVTTIDNKEKNTLKFIKQ